MTSQDENFRMMLSSYFNRNSVDSREESIAFLQEDGVYGNAEFTAKLEALILERKISWSDLAEQVVHDWYPTEDENERFFRYIWDVVSQGRPWPLDES